VVVVVVANGLLLRVVNDDATNTRRWAMLRVTADRARRIIIDRGWIDDENEKESNEELLPSSMTAAVQSRIQLPAHRVESREVMFFTSETV
jgi:hypothetical protein